MMPRTESTKQTDAVPSPCFEGKWPSTVPSYVQGLILEAILPMAQRLDGVILYGSRARGTNHPGSDFDLALVGDALTLQELRVVEEYFYFSPTLYSFDVVLLCEASLPLRKAIERDGISLPFERGGPNRVAPPN